MNSSVNELDNDRKITARDFGVVMGLTAGLGAYSLFTTSKGKALSAWLNKTVKEIMEETEGCRATTRSKTYKELISLIDTIKQTNPVNMSAQREKTGIETRLNKRNLIQSLKNQLFASEENLMSDNPGQKKSRNRHFHQADHKSRLRGDKKGASHRQATSL